MSHITPRERGDVAVQKQSTRQIQVSRTSEAFQG